MEFPDMSVTAPSRKRSRRPSQTAARGNPDASRAFYRGPVRRPKGPAQKRKKNRKIL